MKAVQIPGTSLTYYPTIAERLIGLIAKPFHFQRIKGHCYEKLGPYLDRFYILGDYRRTSWLGFNIYLHHIWRSDIERDLHDHPWSFISLILTGRYEEVTPADCRVFSAGSILLRPAEWQHRLVLSRPMWTLVFSFKKRRSWGFHTDLGWVHHSAYGYDSGDDCK